MKESDLNRIIVKNINSDSWAHKIADPAGIAAKMASKNPFDGFGFSKNFSICFESKLIKNEFRAFQFNAIKPHQIANLLKIRELTINYSPTMLCCIVLGVWFPRRYIELFVFDIMLINKLITNGEKSLLKKDLINLSNSHSSLKIIHGEFNIRLLKEKILYEY